MMNDFLLQGNDEEIGALGSILSWDEEDDAMVGAGVAAASSALEERETLTNDSLPALSGYPQQISIAQTIGAGGQPTTTTTTTPEGYQIVRQTVALASQSQPPLQQAAAMPHQLSLAPAHQQPQALQQHVLTQPKQVTQHQLVAAPGAPVAAPGQQPAQQILPATTAQAQGIRQAQPTTQILRAPAPGTQTSYTIYQQPQMISRANDGTLSMQMIQQQTAAHPQQRATTDANTYLTQVHPHYGLQQATAAQMHPPQNPMVAMTHAQAIASAPPAPTVSTVVAPAPQKRGSKRKVNTNAATIVAPVRSNVVSCSDTDGETKDQNKAKGKKPAVAPNAKKKAEPENTADLTPEEKAKANRDRNREHARNTRLRKKAYLEKLKSTVDELCRERDTLVSERAGAANLMVEIHNTRTEVLMSFFALRSTYEKQRDLWSSILDESCFSCVMPVTPYRSFPASEVQVSKCQRTILGIDGMMADTASLHVLLNSLIDRSRYPSAVVQFRYTLVTEDAVVAGNQMMARWVMSTTNATQLGARMEVAKQGMLCCKFNSAHKIIGLELMFDVMAFMLQLKQAAGSETFSVVPNTVQTCQRSFSSPMVMTLAERPYTIVQVNKLWEDMTGFRAEDVVGKASCRILQGQDTDRAAVEALMSAVRFKRPASATLLNYNRAGKRFRNFVNVYPLSTDSKITHYVALTDHIDMIDGHGVLGTSASVTAPSPSVQVPKQAQPMMPPAEVLPRSANLQVAPPPPGLVQQHSFAPSATNSKSMPNQSSIPGHTTPHVQYMPPQPIISSANMATTILPKASAVESTPAVLPSQPKQC